MTPREPDRFDAKAEALCVRHGVLQRASMTREIAAAVRVEHDAALERAAQSFEANTVSQFGGKEVASILRVLRPPAAAPAADNFQPASEQDSQNTSADAQVEGARSAGSSTPLRGTASGPSLPAAETRKAQAPWRIGSHYGIHVYEDQRPVATFHREEDARRCVEAVNAGKAQEAEALLRECEEWMRGRLRHMGTGTVERISCETILAKLAARAAPPEREGK